MINLVTPEQSAQMLALCGRDPAGIRIAAAYLSYGLAFPFCEFWIQSGPMGPSAVIARLDSHITVCGTPPDLEELSAFLLALGGCNVFVSAPVRLPPPFVLRQTGEVMHWRPYPALPHGGADTHPPLESVFQILAACGQAEALGDHDAWYADVSHRIRHRTARAVMLYWREQPAACALAVAETAACALLGGVAVRPEYQGNGLGSLAVESLCALLQREHKTICLCCVSGGIVGFYRKLNFHCAGGWAIWDKSR